MIVYRIQPIGAELHGIRTTTSNEDLANGVHVFDTLSSVAACRGWCTEKDVELVTIECDARDLLDNEDYEGSLLIRGRGVIVNRMEFADTREVADYADEKAN